jgi:hypothetical protein
MWIWAREPKRNDEVLCSNLRNYYSSLGLQGSKKEIGLLAPLVRSGTIKEEECGRNTNSGGFGTLLLSATWHGRRVMTVGLSFLTFLSSAAIYHWISPVDSRIQGSY